MLPESNPNQLHDKELRKLEKLIISNGTSLGKVAEVLASDILSGMMPAKKRSQAIRDLCAVTAVLLDVVGHPKRPQRVQARLSVVDIERMMQVAPADLPPPAEDVPAIPTGGGQEMAIARAFDEGDRVPA